MKSRIKFTRLNLAFCVCALVFACQTSGFAQSAQIPTAQIVIFTPSDIKPPPPNKGNPIPFLEELLENMLGVCYQQGPILRAVSDAAPMDVDSRVESKWTRRFHC